MPACRECKWCFPLDEDPTKGDCVTKKSDARSEYWSARPVGVEADASKCPDFQVKTRGQTGKR